LKLSFNGVQNWFGWYTVDLPEYSSTNDFFTYEKQQNDSESQPPLYTGSASASINESAINVVADSIFVNTTGDITKISTFKTEIQPLINEKISYQMYSRPDPKTIPSTKKARDIVLDQYKVKETSWSRGLELPGITKWSEY